MLEAAVVFRIFFAKANVYKIIVMIPLLLKLFNQNVPQEPAVVILVVLLLSIFIMSGIVLCR